MKVKQFQIRHRRPMSEETKLKIKNANMGHLCSDETKKKISLANMGRHATEETRRKMSLSNMGRQPMLGKHHSEASKKKISIALKGRAPWHKGRTGIFSEATLLKMRNRMKGNTYRMGIPCLESVKKHMSQKMKGRIFSESTIEKMSLAAKGKPKLWLRGKPLAMGTKIKISNSHRGYKNPNWKGGIYPEIRLIQDCSQYKRWRQSIFMRDNFTCQGCNIKGGYLHAHHIKPFHILIEELKENLSLLDLYDAAMIYAPLWDLDNGITYCKKCHDSLKGKGGIL